MAQIATEHAKKTLPERIRRELRKGETIYHSALPCHISKKHPEGKWIAQVRRESRGKLVKYPVKGFPTQKEALTYILSLRPNAKGQTHSPRQGEPTVKDLYDYSLRHRQKRISDLTRKAKESRWEKYIGPEWGECPISQVTKRVAQEWVTHVEEMIATGRAGNLGLAQFENVRTDLHALFECADSFSPEYEDRRNPFSGLEFTPRPPRVKVTIESCHFSAVYNACNILVLERLCRDWIAEMFLTSLLSGLRRGEVIALCRDQVDLKNKVILVDRAVRRKSKEIDPKTRIEFGAVKSQAMNLPKAGSTTRDKTRIVPMSDQLALFLEETLSNRPGTRSDWDLIWPSESGKPREFTRFQTAFTTLRKRLNEIATYAPISATGDNWPEIPKHRGWQLNPVVDLARAEPRHRLPDIFGNLDFRDTRSSFASYTNEVGIPQATREHILGHGGGLTNVVYTTITTAAFEDARRRLTRGWSIDPE